MDVQKIDAVDAMNGGVTKGSRDNKPRRFVLRDDARCAVLLERLDQLGVAEFRCLTWARADNGIEAFAKTPAFKRGTRLSVGQLREISQLAWRLGNFVAAAVTEALSGTSADGHDLLIESLVIASDVGGPRAIAAWVTVISACDPDFDGRGVDLI